MNKRIVFLSRLCLTTALMTGAAAISAQAGFQWNPPPAAPPATAPSDQSMIAMPAAVETGPLTPMPGEMASVPPVNENSIMDNAPGLPPVTQPQPIANVESDVMPVPQTSGTVEGFGKDIPLAVALSQVVPSGYAVSYQSGIDQGKPISWEGGRPWTDVTNDMLSSNKMHATLNGSTLTISEGPGATLHAPAAPPAVVAMRNNMPAATSHPIPGGGPVPLRPIVDLNQQGHWEATPGQTLQQTLLNWSHQAKVELAWENVGKGTNATSGDIPISRAFSYNGTFDQAVDALLSLYNTGGAEPRGKLYPNLPEGPSVLVVSVK